MNWFEAGGQHSSGVVEVFNSRAKLTMKDRTASSPKNPLKSPDITLIGDLPVPKSAHRFF